MTMFIRALLVAALFAVMPAYAGDAPVRGFSHENKIDMFGYYQPVTPVKSGKFVLDSLHIGSNEDLKKYESGKGRLPTYAPVMFTFSDVTSKKQTNELGGTYFSNAPRVLPGGYRIKEKTIVFIGREKQVGTVTFVGTIDIRPLKDARAKGLSGTDKPVIRGYLTINGKMHKNVAFTWFGGD